MRMAISLLAGACTFSSWVLWGHEGRQSEQVFWADIAVLFGERGGGFGLLLQVLSTEFPTHG